ncbi:histidine ammonia-lyase [Okeania sp. KiyG1]|uniref:HAL/PAL/TAL family ammonia-lyase n=1 Tax=Okeania sp. KiyG1 TaxID=2720165 RepID=UPI00199F84FB|nr:aromatic amino acid ammonia-lyase [Okeania sp. KiyG1]GGA09361.1 histidine ammonia-lyase [Okeania sp. KiyG1]
MRNKFLNNQPLQKSTGNKSYSSLYNQSLKVKTAPSIDNNFFIRKSQSAQKSSSIVVGEHNLTLTQVAEVAKLGAPVTLTKRLDICQGIQDSCNYITNAVETGKSIYGVTTGFGGMGNTAISCEDAAALQENLIWFLKTGAGNRLPIADVRAAMLLRMNSHTKGASGIRYELIQRMAIFLNEGITPHVYDLGSIGASGDLVPLAHITGALLGLDPAFTVDFKGTEISAIEALNRLKLPTLSLCAKEGLAMVNGTSVMTGIAANCVNDAHSLFSVAIATHALMIQALGGTNQSFHPFIHGLKPHPGQVWVAEQMVNLLSGSYLSCDELNGDNHFDGCDLIQDRYSIRCLPQYLGPVVDGLWDIAGQIETEINSVTDNPLIDAKCQSSYHGGNFLGQYVGVGMDRLRYLIGLIAKHLDVQIALLVTPEFNGGLPASLVGNTQRKVNMGLKGLQIAGNSIMPLLTFYGNSLADRFPTHAEQFNQNINSQGFGSANLTRTSINLFRQYLAIALIFAVQAVEQKNYLLFGNYDVEKNLSPATKVLYNKVRELLGKPVSKEKSLIWDDCEQSLDIYISLIVDDLSAPGQISQAVSNIFAELMNEK